MVGLPPSWHQAATYENMNVCGRNGMELGKCPLCSGAENAIHRLLKYPESQRWREKLLNRRCLAMNQDIAVHDIVGCTKTTLLRKRGKFLYSIR
jgi:hypothetical protein